jgi:hypothetical protein
VIVYTSIRYDLSELLAAVRVVTGDTSLVGASARSVGRDDAAALLRPGSLVAMR